MKVCNSKISKNQIFFHIFAEIPLKNCKCTFKYCNSKVPHALYYPAEDAQPRHFSGRKKAHGKCTVFRAEQNPSFLAQNAEKFCSASIDGNCRIFTAPNFGSQLNKDQIACQNARLHGIAACIKRRIALQIGGWFKAKLPEELLCPSGFASFLFCSISLHLALLHPVHSFIYQL